MKIIHRIQLQQLSITLQQQVLGILHEV